MKLVYAPDKYPVGENESLIVFLAGSIEMGKAVDWQSQVAKRLERSDVTLLNPRRKGWDSSWKQTPDFPQFNEQVNWELNGIENATLIIVNFDKNTKSPITLLELGYILGKFPEKAIVCCPKEFYRYGNVAIICERCGVEVYETLDEVMNLMAL